MTATSKLHSRWARRRLGQWRREALALDEIGRASIDAWHQLGLSRNPTRPGNQASEGAQAILWCLLSTAQ